MAFKMKGPSLYKNGALGKNLNVQKDYAGQADGRATSSPLQQTEKQKANLPKEIVNAIAKKQGNSPILNYKNPQDYKVFNMGNKPTPVQKKGKTMAYQKKTKEDYMKDGFNQTDADKMMKDGAVTGAIAGGKMKKKKPTIKDLAKNRNMVKKMGTKMGKESTAEAIDITLANKTKK